jgi:hypothetical protein
MKLTVISITVIIIIVVAALWYFKSNKSKENFANDLMQNVLQDTQAARQGLNSMMGMINQMQPLINTISPQMPQGMMPQGMMPQGMMPQGMMPQGMMPQGMMQGTTINWILFTRIYTKNSKFRTNLVYDCKLVL